MLAGQLDVSGRFTKDMVVKAFIATDLLMGQDENTQVNGLRFLVDFTGFEMKQMTYFGLDDMRKMTSLWMVRISSFITNYVFLSNLDVIRNINIRNTDQAV